jgi:hypothetical protein
LLRDSYGLACRVDWPVYPLLDAHYAAIDDRPQSARGGIRNHVHEAGVKKQHVGQ